MYSRATSLRVSMLAGAALAGLAASLAPSCASAQAPGEAGAPAAQLDEIVVTAQRREENLQEVPIAVTAVGEQALQRAGISTTSALPQLVPSVQMTRSGPSGLFFVRGVGTTNAAAGEEGANALYVDGVYIGDLSQTINNFNNISRIEVLKGPQGTLFGRNATGGLIHVITREPGTEKVLKGQIGYGNYDTVSGQLYAGGPLAENLAGDIALTGSDQNNGWGRNRTTGQKIKKQEFWGARSKIVWRPTDALKFTLAGDYNRNKDDLGLAWRLEDGVVGTGGVIGPRGQDTTSNTPAQTNLKIWGVSLTGEADLGFATLTNVAAMRRIRNHSSFDVDGGPINLVNIDYVAHARTYQEELRLASNAEGRLQWQTGAFYLRSEAETDQTQFGLAFAAPPLSARQLDILSSLKTDSYAAFGEATYAITPTTKITGGVRYTMDRRHFDGNQTPVFLTGVVGPTSSNIAKLSYNKFTYRVALRQEINDDVSVYASVNRGFKAGSFSLQSPLSPAVKPQYIMAYEAGLKSEWFDRKLRLNLAAYHYDIDDYQVRSAATANPGASLLLNAATVKVDGFDLEFEAAPTEELRLFGGFTALDSRFHKFGGSPVATVPQAPIAYANPATCPAALRGTEDPGVLGAGPRTGGFTTCFGDVSGNDTPLAPTFSGSFGASYTAQVQPQGELRISALYSYNSGYVFEPDNLFDQGPYQLLNVSMEYRPTEHFGVEFWVKNLTGTEYSVQKLTTGTGTTVALGAPRTYGVNLKYDF
ncbi:TonB-dependent receptor [Phenylobacterium sp. LjRoot225]|uniref:TonB-dependent receptor n=1 Tax=Phenylobacterium sp. LjRoot225 TaxID=3342285 RepID=UPI003ECCBD1B